MGAPAFSKIKRLITGRLQNQLIFVFSWIVLFIVLIPTSLYYKQTTNMIEDSYIASSKELLKLVNLNLDNYLNQIDDLSLTPRKDEQFMSSLYSEDFINKTYIQKQIRNLFYSRDDIEEISIYTPINNQVYTISRSLVNMVQEQNEQIPQEKWYIDAAKSKRFRSIESAVAAPGKVQRTFLRYHRLIINIADQRPLAAITITLNTLELNKIMGGIIDRPNESIGIFNSGEEAFYLQGGLWDNIQTKALFGILGGGSPEPKHLIWNNGTDKLLVIQSVSTNGNWKLVKLIPMDILYQGASQAREFDLLLGAGLFVLFLIIVLLVSRMITRRLKKFSSDISQLRDGNLNWVAEIKGSDEIAQLSRKFNQMMVRINELIKERYEIKINERNAQLKALEAQINPHFLYNSLQAISTEAITHDMHNMADMVDALASTLRYCIKETEQVKINDEIRHVENYLLLQKARFGDRLNVEFRIRADVEAFLVPKMLVQILVENAIKHGLEQTAEPFRIVISGEIADSSVVLAVRDDGPGMDAERLRQVRSYMIENEADGQQSIGLKNLYTRLKLKYGSQTELWIASRPGEGTEVRIQLPLGEDPNHV